MPDQYTQLPLIVTEKRCTKCGETKPLDAYSPDRRKTDGRQGRCKACRAVNATVGYHADPEHVHAIQRRSYAKQSEKRRAEARQYYWSQPDEHRAASRRYIREHREERRHYQRTHAQVYVMSCQRRRARIRGASRNDFTSAQWRETVIYFGGICAYCGESKPLTVDHVIPLARGGDHTAENIVPACGSCNSRKQHGPLWRML